ncbi:MAG: hypothetical protein SNG69_09630 [Rikenellaceae bacterium]
MAKLSSSITYLQPQATSRLRNNLHPLGSILPQKVVGMYMLFNLMPVKR